MRVVAFLLIAISICTSSSYAAEDEPRNGNWWNGQSRSEKIDYVIGMFDGTILGRNFATWNGMKDGKAEDWAAKADASYKKYVDEYMTDITARQVADGLDVLYSDFKNRTIMVANGVWVVLRQIKGSTPSEVEQLLENLRRYSGRR